MFDRTMNPEKIFGGQRPGRQPLKLLEGDRHIYIYMYKSETYITRDVCI